ncbi:hypothetical protein RR46_08800 [Papilio xuthus]|uniref:Uncharacterized protein n=1 Tax=Papilio xuthus TaxID=66420 RepID=A0A194PPH2_PAPXU|nr:hypothetical protein RR46_08800 [Papilio xuthus]
MYLMRNILDTCSNSKVACTYTSRRILIKYNNILEQLLNKRSELKRTDALQGRGPPAVPYCAALRLPVPSARCPQPTVKVYDVVTALCQRDRRRASCACRVAARAHRNPRLNIRTR